MIKTRRGTIAAALAALAIVVAGWIVFGGWYGSGPLEKERTFIVSTHIIEEAASVFERVMILDEGKIIENAETEELIAQFHTVTGREDMVDEVTRGLQVLSVQLMGRHKSVVVRGDAVKLKEAQSADVDVAPMSLQKVFVALCGHEEAQQ